jgi:hypothetical protein
MLKAESELATGTCTIKLNTVQSVTPPLMLEPPRPLVHRFTGSEGLCVCTVHLQTSARPLRLVLPELAHSTRNVTNPHHTIFERVTDPPARADTVRQGAS